MSLRLLGDEVEEQKMGAGEETAEMGWAFEINQPSARVWTVTFTRCMLRVHHIQCSATQTKPQEMLEDLT